MSKIKPIFYCRQCHQEVNAIKDATFSTGYRCPKCEDGIVYMKNWGEVNREEQFNLEDAKAENIWSAIKVSRDEPGVSIRNIAEIIKKVFDEAEVKSLIRELYENKQAKS